MRFYQIFLIVATITIVSSDEEEKTIDLTTFPKKLLARRREEHLALLKGIASNAKYEWRFQLVELGVTKVLELIEENRKLEVKGDDKKEKMTEFKMLILENSCLLMDFIVNFNEDIYVIFKKVAKNGGFDWRERIKFIFEYLEKEVEMLDELTTQEYEFIKSSLSDLLDQKQLPEYMLDNNIKRDINMAERIYANEKQMQKELNKKKDKKEKRKGPQLQLPIRKTEL